MFNIYLVVAIYRITAIENKIVLSEIHANFGA